MFLDENERTEKSVMKRSKSSSRKTPSDTSSAPSRRSSPTLTTMIDTSATSRNASLPSLPRRSPSAGPSKTTRASDRRKSRTTTPEEGGTRSRAVSRAALRRTVSAQQSISGEFLQPFDSSIQQQQQHLHQLLQTQHLPSSTNFDFSRDYDLMFEVASTNNMSTSYSQGSGNAAVPSINIPLHFDNMHIGEQLNFVLPGSTPHMSFSMASSTLIHDSQQHFPRQHPHQQPHRGIIFPPNTGYEDQWDCNQWVHDIPPPHHTEILTPQLPLPSDEEWLQWQWDASAPQQ